MVTVGSSNPYPSVLFVEGAAPTTPAAGTQRLFVDTADGLLKLKDDAGVVTAIGGSAAAHIADTSAAHAASAVGFTPNGSIAATDVQAAIVEVRDEASGGFVDPMTTRGDVIVRNAANATARLAIGTTGKVLQSDGTDISWQTPAGGGSAGVGAKASKNATQSLTTGTETAVTWPGSDTFDTDAFHDPATNSSRMTIPVGLGGKYACIANVGFAFNGTGTRYLFFKVTGATISEYSTQAGNAAIDNHLHHAVVLDLAAGDYVEVFAYQSSGGALNVLTVGSFSIMQV